MRLVRARPKATEQHVWCCEAARKHDQALGEMTIDLGDMWVMDTMCIYCYQKFQSAKMVADVADDMLVHMEMLDLDEGGEHER